MTTNNISANMRSNLYIISTLGILLIVIAIAFVWVSQYRQAIAMAAAQPVLAKGDAAAGQASFAQTCSACHGPTAEGLPNLGKNLVTSQFVKGQTDVQLLAFLKVGRSTSDPLNTTKVDMPPKGGNPVLNDKDLENIIAFIRTINK